MLSIRKFDDKIINILNTEIPTESFYLKEANPSKKCEQFKQEVAILIFILDKHYAICDNAIFLNQLTDYYDFRENEILKCIESTKKELEALKSNPNTKNLVREKNTNLRMFHQELDVERIIRKNTYKVMVFYSRLLFCSF